MTDYQDDDLPLTPQEARELYGFRPGELEAAAAERELLVGEIAAREAKLKAAEAVAWARNQQAELEAGRRVVKDFGAPYHRQTAAPAPVPAPSSDWWRYIERRVEQGIAKRERCLLKGIGQVLAEVEKAHAGELAKLRAEFAAALELEATRLRNEFLQDRLDQKRGVKQLKVVPPSEAASLIA